jgi:sarcosine oxidase gamma subunit
MHVGPAGALYALDLWDDAAPGLPGPGRSQDGVLRVGPRRWWIDGTMPPDPGDRGVITAIGGGWTRVTLIGATWRDLIMHAGLIDAEHPDFGPGSVAVTTLSHADCVIHVRGPAQCEVFVPSSLAEHCLGHWRALGWHQVTAA